MAVFKRAWRLQLQIDNVIKTYQEIDYNDESLKIEFNIINGVGGVFSSGNITIYGLNENDMQYLATCFNPFTGTFKRNLVSLEAGYINSLALIIKGNISGVEADFSSVDKKITLQVQSAIGNNLRNNAIQTSLNGSVDFKSICESCAKNNGLKLKYDNKIKKRFLEDYSFQGSPFQQIEQLRKFFDDLNVFIDNTSSVLNVLLKDDGEVINTNVLSKDTGLIGKPAPTNIGCNVRSYLNTNFIAGGRVELKNTNLTSFDGKYTIIELRHIGSNRGDNWETQLSLRRNRG